MKERTRHAAFYGAGMVMLLMMTPVFGQEETNPNGITEANNRTIYSAAYFSQYSPVTARDQLDLIPGIQSVIGGNGGGPGSQDQRGFGNSGDRVLINGERISGKSNDIGSVLGRIQARQVLRVEVIHGPEAGLDVRGQGPFVNLVTDGEVESGYGSWGAEWNHYADGHDQYGLDVNYAGNNGAFNYLFSAEANPRSRRWERTETFYDTAGAAFERQRENDLEETVSYALTANTGYRLNNGDILNINALYERDDQATDELSARYQVVGGEETFDRDVIIARGEIEDSWELGGDFSHQQSNGSSLKLLFVFANSSVEGDSTFTRLAPDEPAVIGQVQLESREDSESIVRGTYRWGVTENSSFESGMEAALNSLEREITLYEDDDGVLKETGLFNQSSTVEEKRLEAFTAYSTSLRDDVFLEASLDLEYSELSQAGGDVGRSRDFFFTRPRAVLRHDVSDSAQLSARVERKISQLEFSDFVSSFSNDDNRSGSDAVNAGNPELVPEKTWEYELSYQHRFADDLGVVTLTGLYQDVDDHLATLPFVVTNDSGDTVVRPAPGNIGEGRRVSVSVDGSLRLSWIKLPRVMLEGDVAVNESRVTDPFTGEERDFHNVPDYEWSLGFRHDTLWRNLSYGVTAEQRGPRFRSDLDYVQWHESKADLEIFAELQPLSGITLRLEVQDALSAENRRERLQFDGNRGDGILLRSEERFYRPVRSITFSVQGVF